MTDEDWMTRALNLARLGVGLTRPNPPVGAIIVKRGKVIGKGFHRKAGGAHAEINALIATKKSKKDPKGSTLYVTLEPCSTFGRTPPCTEAVLRAGITRVVVGCEDPNPSHSGTGLAKLQGRGVDVRVGVHRAEAEALIEPFATRLLKGRPFVTLKMAMTLDGKIADEAHQSKWITGSAARDLVQALRRRADAVLVGTNTILYDNPSLIPRPREGRLPYRVVIDRQGRLPADSKVFTDQHADHTLVYRDPEQGLAEILNNLAANDIMHLLCEGGGQLAAALVRESLVDEFQFFIAPKFLGGTGINVLGGKGWRMDELPELRFVRQHLVGDDLLVVAKPDRSNEPGE